MIEFDQYAMKMIWCLHIFVICCDHILISNSHRSDGIKDCSDNTKILFLVKCCFAVFIDICFVSFVTSTAVQIESSNSWKRVNDY